MSDSPSGRFPLLTDRRRSLQLALLVGLALLVVVAAACGGSSDEDTLAEEASTPTDEPVPTEEAPAESGPAVPVGPLPADRPGSRSDLSMELPSGATLDYTLVLPDNFVPGEAHPTLLALPPGGQGQAEVNFAVDLYWGAEGRERGWVVVSPVAPEGQLFFRGSEVLIPEFLHEFASLYPPEGDRFHVSGVSNGGLSAYRVALNSPELYQSVLAAPGHPPTEQDSERLDRLAGVMPVAMYVGENDSGWVEAAQAAEARLSELGGDVSLTVSPGEGHILQNIGGAEFYDFLDSAR